MLIHTPTPNIESSYDFYKKLRFEIVQDDATTWALDGPLVIEVNKDRYARPGIKFFEKVWKPAYDKLQAKFNLISTENGYLFGDPSGVRVYLVRGQAEIPTASNPSPQTILGNYAGVSLESTDMASSSELYQLLGFQSEMGSVEQGWVSLKNAEGEGISLMKPNTCPHLFFNPSLTYFNGGNNPEVIQKLRDAGIPITEEITYFNKEGIVDNVIIRDPGGYGFFIFND